MGRYALIVGNAEYQDPKLARLVAPTEDVRSLAEVLRNAQIGAFDDVFTLVNETGANIRKAVSRFFLRKDRDDLLLFYFSGHGVRDDRGALYLAVKDTEPDVLSGTAIEADFVTGEMDRSHSRRQVLILDCCHSAAFARGTKAAAGESVGTAAAFEGTGYGRVVLTASDATQFALDAPEGAAGATPSVFTRYLVDGLRTGEADGDDDGRITLDELYDYLYTRVISSTANQTPKKFTYDQQGAVLIAKNPRAGLTPVDLPGELVDAINSAFADPREKAVRELQRLLNGPNKGLSRAAAVALTKLEQDDSRRVASLAAAALATRALTPPTTVPVDVASVGQTGQAVDRAPGAQTGKGVDVPIAVGPTKNAWPPWASWPLIAAAVGAAFLIAIVALSPRPTAPSTGTAAGPTSPPSARFVLVPNVYNLLEKDGTKTLSDSGFTSVIWYVCSSSVEAGHIRQVVLTDGNNNVTDILVDKDGVTTVGRQVDRGTRLVVKVANGAPCTQ